MNHIYKLFIFFLAISYSYCALPEAIITGESGNSYAAFVDAKNNSAGPEINGLPDPSNTKIRQGSIANNGLTLITGVSTFPLTTPYAALIDSNTNTVGLPVLNLPTPGGNSFLSSGEINNIGQMAIVAGDELNFHWAAFIDPSINSALAPISNLPGPTGRFLQGSSINNSNLAIVTGTYSSPSIAYAALVDFGTNTAGPPVLNVPTTTGGKINDAAINNLNQIIIGGQIGGTAYAAFVDLNTNTAGSPVINIPTSPGSSINSWGVAINDNGVALIGGSDGTSAYAAYVNIDTNAAGAPIQNLPTVAGSFINGVSINNLNQGLIGGSNGTSMYAAFVDPITNSASNPISNLPTLGGSVIFGVSLLPYVYIPTRGLSSNNLAFANYINEYCIEKVFYFIPAILNGNLNKALEKAAPTRNAISLFAADNNLFSLNKGLSTHLRNHRYFRTESCKTNPKKAREENAPKANNTNCLSENPNECHPIQSEDRPYTVWVEGTGFFASQKHQHQTTGFDPYGGGVTLGLDRNILGSCQMGGGVAYTYTHIHQHSDTGHSNINQEYLFTYFTWSNQSFYVDTALWGSLFQIHNVRDIHLSGWEFTSTSNPKGWQLTPHLELGYRYSWRPNPQKNLELTVSPFVMMDWANNWQRRYQEKGKSPFNIVQNSHHSSFLRSEAGFRMYERVNFCFWNLIFEESVSYVNRTPFSVGKVKAHLVGCPGSFTVETLNGSKNLVACEFSTIFRPVDFAYPYGSVTYYGEFTHGYQSHQLTMEISWDF
ncbi:MAG: autotransporter outer membrane beta-barrel domain-containing protein [Simkaniaceae bacterium]|nr:MAG: autotransporter outer membrane beta-barrel domain-containing protein [Simkaniaceae bacterium]